MSTKFDVFNAINLWYDLVSTIFFKMIIMKCKKNRLKQSIYFGRDIQRYQVER